MRRPAKIFLWVAALAVISGGIFLLSHIKMSKEQAVNRMVTACTQNTPFDPEWTKTLSQTGIQHATENMPEKYCICFYTGLFDQMDQQQIVRYADATREERENILGGRQVLTSKHKQCLQQLKP